MDRLVLNEEIHEVVFKDLIPNARKFIWVATADLKTFTFRGPLRNSTPFSPSSLHWSVTVSKSD